MEKKKSKSGAKFKQVFFTIKKQPRPGGCRLIENGKLCDKEHYSRGVCGSHYTYLRVHKLLEEYALPSVGIQKREIIPNPNPILGICPVIEDGQACDQPGKRKGLCDRHYANIWQRSDLSLDDFYKPYEIKYSRKKNIEEGICIVREHHEESIIPCEAKAIGRGFCSKHKSRFYGKDIFEELANKLAVEPTYRIKEVPIVGKCAVIENGILCDGNSHIRHVCSKHYHAFKRKKLIHLTDHLLEEKFTIEPKKLDFRILGFCNGIVNNIPCTNKPYRRGLCRPCIDKIEKAGLSFEDFANAKAEKSSKEFARKSLIIDGVCIILENGLPCSEKIQARGLCKFHYKALKRLGKLDELAFNLEENSKLISIPHFYLDKNIPIRYAMYEVFGSTAQKSSIIITQAVMEGKFRATVSLDCIRALYSHLGHRLARPINEDGKNMSPKEAEAFARDYVGKFFFDRGGHWTFMPLEQEHFYLCAGKKHLPNLSLEDALEMHTYAKARNEFNVQMFVTADNGIIKNGEGVHPDDVVKQYKLKLYEFKSPI